MAIEFSCRCGKRFRVPDSLAAKSSRCSACGEVLQVPSLKTSVPGENVPPEYGVFAVQCPNCGSPLEADAQLCVRCGTMVSTGARVESARAEDAHERSGPTGKKSARVIGGVVGGLLLVAGIILVGAMMTRDPSAPIEPADTVSGISGSESTSSAAMAGLVSGVPSPYIRRVPAGAISINGKPDEWVAAKIEVLSTLEPVPVMRGEQGLFNAFNQRRFQTGSESVEVGGMAFAHDGANLYVMLILPVGAEEKFEQARSTSMLGYIELDTDDNASTGLAKRVHRETGGFDCTIALATGFHAATGKPAVPAAVYEVSRNSAVASENTPGDRRATHEDPNFIALAGSRLEMRIPFEILGIKPPAQLKVYYRHTGFGGNSQVFALQIE